MAKRSAKPEVGAQFARVVAAFGRRTGVTLEPGWGAGNLVLKVNAKIFAMEVGGRLVVKLAKARVDDIVAAGGGTASIRARTGA
jgi:hypothetical protein